MYFVEFSETAEKEIEKIFKHESESYKEIIKNSLQNNPTDRGKFYGRSTLTNLIYFEKRIYSHGGIRAFYTVSDGKIIIVDIEYDGKVSVHRIADKHSQKRIGRQLGL